MLKGPVPRARPVLRLNLETVIRVFLQRQNSMALGTNGKL